ncbi:hypothetical protein [Erwinia sp. JH02]|uniref:hypothetical protein n=1 Tax=Erwinia sp. JH02 TaxID=2733394 RepID=UPI001489517E|nr:hypothetical protein [Erwinia sp. JH02]NNS07613.1 hypothetical protein [Erwinia sp. JH02]
MNFSSVYICCPANVVTGGPELLHQFASKLQDNGVDSYLIYYPFEHNFDTPKQYKHYNVRVATLGSVKNDSLVVLPETATVLAKKFSHQQLAIWWLSVDNYYGCPPESFGLPKFKHLAALVRNKKLSINKMKGFIHLHQSEYARLLLAKHNIHSMQMTDYISSFHFRSETKNSLENKKKIISYNPKKGVEMTRKIITACPEFTFVPLENMTAQEVNETLSNSMIYIDFGNHPGKDRFPREAALANCCIITGRRGSAKNMIDVSIPERFKLDENDDNLIDIYKKMCNKIFKDFSIQIEAFEKYRESIKSEGERFEQNVNEFMRKYIISK